MTVPTVAALVLTAALTATSTATVGPPVTATVTPASADLITRQTSIEGWMLLVQFGTVIILAATAIVTATMACATRNMAAQTKRMADGTEKQVQILAAEHEMSQQPWVFPTHIELLPVRTAKPDVIPIGYKLKNHTDAPAKRCACDMHAIFLSGADWCHAVELDRANAPLPLGAHSEIYGIAEIPYPFGSEWQIDMGIPQPHQIIATSDLGEGEFVVTLQLTITTHYYSISNKHHWNYARYEYDQGRNAFKSLKYQEGIERNAGNHSSDKAGEGEQHLV